VVRRGPRSGSAIGKFDRACHVFHPCSLHPAGRLGCIFSPHRCRSVSKLKVYLVMSATLAAAGQNLHCERHQSRSLQVTYAPPNVDMHVNGNGKLAFWQRRSKTGPIHGYGKRQGDSSTPCSAQHTAQSAVRTQAAEEA
jgi:hypothetical protein